MCVAKKHRVGSKPKKKNEMEGKEVREEMAGATTTTTTKLRKGETRRRIDGKWKRSAPRTVDQYASPPAPFIQCPG